jgi:hypothetical protein
MPVIQVANKNRGQSSAAPGPSSTTCRRPARRSPTLWAVAVAHDVVLDLGTSVDPASGNKSDSDPASRTRRLDGG